MIGQWLRKHPWVHLWLPVAAWMGVIFYLSAQPDLPHVDSGLLGKLISCGAHALEFGVLAVLLARAMDGQPRALLIAFVVAVLYGVSDEFHQSFVPGRTPDVLDLVCDGLGAAVGLAVYWVVRRRVGRRSPAS
jgi:VanZ family protein